MAWLRESVAGAVSSVVILAVIITLGQLGFSTLGEAAAQVGIQASFAAVIIGGVVYALVGRGAMPTSGPSSATALIMAGLIAKLVSDPQILLSDSAGLGSVLVAASLVVVLMGLMQMALAKLGLGHLSKFVAQPVLGGFMNGVAVLIVLSQLPTLLGLAASYKLDLSMNVLAQLQPATLLVGLATAACVWWMGRRWPKLPSTFIGLLVGTALFAGLSMMDAGMELGPLVGQLPDPAQLPELPLRLLAPSALDFALSHTSLLLTTALVLALISSLESVLCLMSIDRDINSRQDTGHELYALGLANAVAGVFGALPSVLSRTRATTTLRAGGQGWRAALFGSLVLALLYLLCAPLIALLPRTVLAGVMLTIAVALLDHWTRQLLAQFRAGERSVDVAQSLAIVGLVCVVTIWQGFAIAVAVGVIVSLLVFIRGMSRSLVRAQYKASNQPSRRSYPERQEQVLHPARDSITVFELEGELFFGSADRLVSDLERLGDNCSYLVLDFRRVRGIDESGAVMLHQLARRLEGRGIDLLMAGVSAESRHGRRMHAFGLFRERPDSVWFPDVDRAVEAAELRLLRKSGVSETDDVVPLRNSSLTRGLGAGQVDRLSEYMTEQRVPAGATLFRAGDPADCLYVLEEGRVSVFGGSNPEQGQRRYLSLSAGMMLGETAMLDGRGRSASAIADSDVLVRILSKQSLDQMSKDDPTLAAALFRNIAIHLSERLRGATASRSDMR